jgi:hypothetical protein
VTKELHREWAEIVLFLARNRAPVGPGRRGHRPGALRRSGRASGTKTAGFVRFGNAQVPYAGPIHFGHRPRSQGGYTLPQPFLYDAADERFDAVYSRFQRHLESVLRAQGLA